MTRIAADSTTLAHDPAAVDVVFYYVNGHLGVSTSAEAGKLHPGKVVLGIDVTGAAPSAAVRDWEAGDKGGDLEQWVIQHNKASGRPDATVYCDRSTVPEVRQLTGSQVLGKDYWLWVATLDGTLVTGPGIVACQVVTVAGYDLSVVWDDSWHPSPTSVKAELMQDLAQYDRTRAQLAAHIGRLPG